MNITIDGIGFDLASISSVRELERIEGLALRCKELSEDFKEEVVAFISRRVWALSKEGLVGMEDRKVVEVGRCRVALLDQDEGFMFLPGVDIQVIRREGLSALLRTIRLKGSQDWALGSFLLSFGPLMLTGKISRSSRMWRGGPRCVWQGRPSLVPCFDQGAADMMDLAQGLRWNGEHGTSRHSSNPFVEAVLSGFNQLNPDLLDKDGNLVEVDVRLPKILQKEVSYPAGEFVAGRREELREERRQANLARRERREEVADVDPEEALDLQG